ncbi:LigA [Rhodotorula toruloides ATCC 204091]|uniref:BY PROTMAP: gi/342319186/gb/EGU11136.1/ LigA [Rhodotorula glutinis ATCC 204091] n=1 Tax=Rhodotorula toruloides TaxID=5286 RepID=A0A0K3CKQ4_RHOTO|nr:LigA [Rhodotorula toruloides ATCC 204091]KAK4329732.1 LigA [Rhodotorula toruloides]
MLRDELLALKSVTAAPVDPHTDLTTLPAAHLAVLALRADLDVLLRQRAYHAFLVKAAEEDGCGGVRDFLSTPLPQPYADSLHRLTLSQLLSVQFRPDCDSDALATQAYSVFLAKLDLEIVQLPLDFPLRKYTMSWDGGEREDEGELMLRLEESGMKVFEGEEVLFSLEPERVLSFRVEQSDATEAPETATILVLRLSQVDLGLYISIRDLEVRLVLETANLDGGAGERLMKMFASWAAAEKADFPVEDEDNIELKIDVEADPAAPSTASSASPDLAAQDSPATPATSLPPPSPVSEKVSNKPPRKRVKRSDEDEERGAVEQPWQYLGERSVHVTWHPGLYTRQFALLRAIAPRVVEDLLDPPCFTTEELALLSLATDPKTLAKLPFPPESVSQRYRHKWEERLALERIYQEREHINVDQTRLVLLTSNFPSLRLYAQVLSKVVKARDMLTKAYDTVLHARLYPRLKDRTTYDPIERIVVLVERLRDDVHYRNTLFSTSNVSLVTNSPLSDVDIGKGPARRYEAELKLIVEYEKESLKIAREKVESLRVEMWHRK